MITINNTVMNIKHFPDNTMIMLDLKIPLTSHKCPIEIVWQYENSEEQLWLYYFVNFIKDNCNYRYNKLHLILPYLPNARMDRTKNENDVHVLKYFCKFINDLNFETVVCFDIHSSVGSSMLNNLKHIMPIETIRKVINKCKPDFVFYPDEGAMKRYSDLIKFSYLYGMKKRNWEDGKIVGVEIINPSNESIVGKKILIIDDITSYGGTFYYAGKALKNEMVGDIYLYVTHCENSVMDEEKGLLNKEDNPIIKIFTTNSLNVNNNSSIEQLSIL